LDFVHLQGEPSTIYIPIPEEYMSFHDRQGPCDSSATCNNVSPFRKLFDFLQPVILHRPGRILNLSKSLGVQKVFGTDLGEHLSTSPLEGKFRVLSLYGIFNEAYFDITYSFLLWSINFFKWRY
jgi:hypothetical protein